MQTETTKQAEDEELLRLQARLDAKRAALGVETRSQAQRLSRVGVGRLEAVPLRKPKRRMCQWCAAPLAHSAESPSCPDCQDARKFWSRARDVSALMADAGVRDVHQAALTTDFSRSLRCQIDHHETGRGMFLLGLPGRGKSHLAAALLRLGVLAGQQCRMVLARAMFREIWSTYRDDSKRSEEQVVRDLCRLDLLVIDDLGPGREGRVSEAVIGALHEVLTERQDRRRETIITTNFSLEAIEENYGAAIRSRISAMDLIVVEGDDWRLR